MVNIVLLKQLISDSGMTMVAIAEKSGIERATLYNRLRGKGDFTASEIEGLRKTLRLKRGDIMNIFFS